jgi:predicted RNA binding protein YcfA (HicA-like mRNA interferase family)
VRNDKRLERLRLAQTSVRFRELESLLLACGFVLDRIAGSHHLFVHARLPLTVIVPLRQPTVLRYVVKDVLKAIDAARAAESAEEE